MSDESEEGNLLSKVLVTLLNKPHLHLTQHLNTLTYKVNDNWQIFGMLVGECEGRIECEKANAES